MEYYEDLTKEKAFYTVMRKNLQDILLTKEDKVKKHAHNHTASLLPSRNTPSSFLHMRITCRNVNNTDGMAPQVNLYNSQI